jgi:hypothetical protein
MKEIHNVTLDNLPTKLEEIKIKAITVPYYLFHFFTRKRRRQQEIKVYLIFLKLPNKWFQKHLLYLYNVI